MSSIKALMIPSGEQYMCTREWMTFIDSLIPWLKTSSTTTTVMIQPQEGSVWAYNLTGLLLDNNVEKRYHYIVQRMNDLDSITDVDPTLNALLIPDVALVSRLVQVYRTGL